jgi:hypothetical protein
LTLAAITIMLGGKFTSASKLLRHYIAFVHRTGIRASLERLETI